jgi:adenine deaminase
LFGNSTIYGWLKMSALNDAFFRAIPKVELHCHLYGALRRKTFETLVRRKPCSISEDDITAFYTRGEKPVGVLRVLRALDAELITSSEDIYRLTIEYLEDASQHNVRYTEFFWNPTGTAEKSGIAYPAALAAIRRAIADAQTQFGIIGRLIAAIDREASPQAANQMVQWVQEHRCDEVIGIGIDYRENDRPPELFTQAYLTAKKHALKTTAHAGEFGMPWNNVQTAIDILKVDRLDHAYTIMDNPALIQRCVESGIVITVVPTNSFYLRTLSPERWAQDHPIRAMAAAGLRIHPNTDDPTLHQVTPSKAWQMMHEYFGLSEPALKQCMHNGLNGAWIDETTRRNWQQQFDTEWNRLL